MMTMNATTTTPTSAFSWSSKTRSPKPLSRSPPDQTQTQSTRGNRRKRRKRKRKEKEASPNPLSGNNNAFSSRLLRAGGSRATCVVLCGVSARERELVFFMRYKPTSSLLFFCFSLVYFFLFFFSSIFLLVSFFSLSRVCSLTKANFYTSTKGGSEKRSKKPTFLRPFGLTAMISAHGYSVDVQKYDSRHIFRCLPNSTLRDLPPYLCAECP